MNLQEAMEHLESFGTEQNRKIYKNHGASDNQFGVSYANLKKLKKQIKTDQTLAEQLWETGNDDARVLAMMITDPNLLTAEQVEGWLRDCTYYGVTDALVTYAASKAPFAKEVVGKWMASDEELIGYAGYQLLAHLALHDTELDDAYFSERIAHIAAHIHEEKNRTRYGMNNALIAIGTRNGVLEAQAMEAAIRIGKVYVDHGNTSCKTPDAAAYIKKTNARKKKA